MVENIERFGTRLKTDSLRNFELANESEVEIERARAPHCISAQIPVRAYRVERGIDVEKAAWVEELITYAGGAAVMGRGIYVW